MLCYRATANEALLNDMTMGERRKGLIIVKCT